MMPSLQEFLTARLPFPGLAAWGACLGGAEVQYQSFAAWLTAAQLAPALGQLHRAAQDLKGYELEPRRLNWAFEHLRIRMVFRSDGAWLALFLENRVDLNHLLVETVVEEFATLETRTG